MVYELINRWKLWLMLAALIIVGSSLVYTNRVANQLANQERERMMMMAEFIKLPSIIPQEVDFDFTIISKMTEMNTSIPMLLTDNNNKIISCKNYDGKEPFKDSLFFLQEVEKIKLENSPIEIKDNFGGVQYIYFRNSRTLVMLQYFPYIQLGLITLLVMIGYLAFSTARRSEQNLVWVGMAKETAHQLGTPLSSLVGWIENLKSDEVDRELIDMATESMQQDLDHLRLVADRFSKIGAQPQLKKANLYEVLDHCYKYIKPRASKRIVFDFPDLTDQDIPVKLNAMLFEWVIENILKNALDAMDGSGSIQATIYRELNWAVIEITDSGKGIPRNKWKTIFKPGYTTKTRGWGMGLSLTKRIVEEYHNGKIFVKNSVVGEGTTFCIKVPVLIEKPEKQGGA